MFPESPFGLADSEIRSSVATDCKSVAARAVDLFCGGNVLWGICNPPQWILFCVRHPHGTKLHVGTPDGTQNGAGHGDDDVEHGVPNGLVHVSESFKG